MVSIPSPSNKGGPAARQGFKYQDHVAVAFIMKMLRDSTYLQVECETADDIVAVSENAGETVNEYIQVKSLSRCPIDSLGVRSEPSSSIACWR